MTGSVKENVLPLPGSLSTQMRPPWYSTISLQMGRPRPVPFGLVGEGVAHLLELLEDLGLIGGRNADAGVSDADDEVVAAADGRHR